MKMIENPLGQQYSNCFFVATNGQWNKAVNKNLSNCYGEH